MTSPEKKSFLDFANDPPINMYPWNVVHRKIPNMLLDIQTVHEARKDHNSESCGKLFSLAINLNELNSSRELPLITAIT